MSVIFETNLKMYLKVSPQIVKQLTSEMKFQNVSRQAY